MTEEDSNPYEVKQSREQARSELSDSRSLKPRPPGSGALSSRFGGKLLLLLGLVAVGGFIYWQFGESLSLEKLAEREEQLREYQAANPWFVYGIAFLSYVAVTGLSLPGATALTLVFAWYFGFANALVLVSFASTSGATLAFVLSRYLLGSSIQERFGDRLASFNAALEREGAFYLFTLRLIPAVPFFVINAVMGLTKLRTWTFWWVSQVGMFPGTVVYVYAGSRVPNLQALADQGINAVFTPQQMAQIIGAFVLLGLFPLVARYLIKAFARKQTETSEQISAQ